MKDYLWDGNMDCGWEDLSVLLITQSKKFCNQILETTLYSPNVKSQELISVNCMNRFSSIITVLAEAIKDGDYYSNEDIENVNDNAVKLNSWILLGSLTEATMQMFLAFYLDDYRNTEWQQWKEFDSDKVKASILDNINNLVSDGSITTQQAKAFKEVIKDKIKEHTKEHLIEKVMLDELIKLYIELDLLDEDELVYLKGIQSNRNGIHSFQNRTIGTWMDLQYSIRFFCYFMEWVLNRMPDILDYC